MAAAGARPAPGRGRVSGSGRQGGNVALELALVLPLFLLLLAGIVDLGMMFWEKQILTNATREGARWASLAKPDGSRMYPDDEIQKKVQSYLDNSNLKDASGAKIALASGANFLCTSDVSTTPGTVTVELKDIPASLMLLPNIQTLFGGSGSDTIKLGAKTTMGAEWTK
jgi:Flp pilus assembly protein TadG